MWRGACVTHSRPPAARASMRPCASGMKGSACEWMTSTGRPRSRGISSTGRTCSACTPDSSRPSSSAPGMNHIGSPVRRWNCVCSMAPKSAKGVSATTPPTAGSAAAARSAAEAPIDAPSSPMRPAA